MNSEYLLGKIRTINLKILLWRQKQFFIWSNSLVNNTTLIVLTGLRHEQRNNINLLFRYKQWAIWYHHNEKQGTHDYLISAGGVQIYATQIMHVANFVNLYPKESSLVSFYVFYDRLGILCPIIE